MRRAIWHGALSFGLVNIPVRLYTGTKDRELKFVLLHKKDMSEIRYARMCKLEEKEIPWDEIVKGYEYKKDNFVVMNEEDFKKADLQKTETIEIINFVDEEEIDSILFVKPYFLEPDKTAGNAYALLREALEKSKKVGIAKYVLRNKEHIAVVKAYKGMLILNELRYKSEIMETKDLNLPAIKKVNDKELKIALQLIDHLTVPFDPSKFHDTYEEELKEIIAKKAKGRPIRPKTKEPVLTKVHDIMPLLQASLENKKKVVKKRKHA